MSIGPQFATRSEVEAMRRKLARAISGASIVQHESDDVDAVKNFVELADVPQTYAGATGELPSVNAAEDGLEFNPYVTVNPTTPILKLRNLTDAEVDCVHQFAVGATPVTRWTYGLDDSLSNDWLLCIGDILTNTVSEETYELDISYDVYILIVDFGNDRIKKHLVADGTYQAEIGTTGNGNNQFDQPYCICSDGTWVYVTDAVNDRIKKHLLSDLSYVEKIGSHGSGNDNFDTPRGICTDGIHLYITDRGNNRIVKRLCSDLSYVAETAGPGLNNPDRICTDGTHVYTIQSAGPTYRIFKHYCNDLSLDTRVLNDGHIDSATLVGICAAGGYLYIMNSNLGSVPSPFFKYSCSDLTYVSDFGVYGTGNGEFYTPGGICSDGTYLYASDGRSNWDAKIQKFLLDGTYVSRFCDYGSDDDGLILPKGLCLSGTIVRATVIPGRGPMLRAYADGSAVDSYPLFRARDGFQLMEDGTVGATDYVGLYAPAAITASYSLTFPGTGPAAAGHFAVDSACLITWGQSVITTASPIFANITDSGLTATHPVFTDGSKKLVSTGTVPVDHGGTGLASYAVGDMLYASAGTTLAQLADVAAGSYLRSGGVTTAPLWSTLILPNAATAYRLPVATSANTIGELAAVGATGQYLAGNTGAIPSWANISAFEPALGNPGTSGFVLSSTDAGVRSWIAPGGGGTFLSLTDVDEADYVGHEAEFVVVNGTADGLVFSASSVAGHTLGGVNHTDVNAAAPNDDDFLSWDAASGKWIPVAGGGGGAPTDAKYIVQEVNAGLSAEQSLGALATGIVKNTTTGAVGVLSIATATDIPAVAISTTTITATGATNWNKVSGARWCLVRIWAAGGSGGRGGAGDGGGGGGGGAYIEKVFDYADLSNPVSVIIGTGGAAQTSDDTAGNVGGNTTFGAYLTAYGGGGGGAVTSVYGGGGGGGTKSVGSVGSGSAGGTGGGPAGGYYTATTGVGRHSSFGGGSGGGAGPIAAGDSGWGGGGGGGGTATTGNGVGGDSLYGGGGGGGGSDTGTPSAGGTSVFGGAGGAGATDVATGTAGTQPGGGGGGSENANSGAGGDGKAVIISF